MRAKFSVLATIFIFFVSARLTFCEEAPKSSNIEYDELAIDEDKCPGVLVYPGTKSGSANAYYFLVKPFPKMNIDFEDVAYIPSFKDADGHKSFYYAFYFPAYNETNPFDEYADVPCSKEQLKREILKTLPASERPDISEINLARLKINTVSFSIPKSYKDRGFELIYDEALSDPQNAGVIYSKGTFILELRIPDGSYENMLEILRSDMGFPMTIKMGFKAKEQRDYKKAYIDIGAMLNELKVKLGAKGQYISEAKLSSTIKTTSSFANMKIYGETQDIDKWICDVLIPLLVSSSMAGQTPLAQQGQQGNGNVYVPPAQQQQATISGSDAPGKLEDNKVYLALSNNFESDVKKFTFESDVLNPFATQEYLIYQYPLRYFGELDGNYFVLESNRYEEAERYSQIHLDPNESIEFSIEGYWEVTPKLVRQKYYYTKDDRDAGELPYLFTRDNPNFMVESGTNELFVYNNLGIFPGLSIKGVKLTPYAKIGTVKLEPVSWGNGYFPRYFKWKPKFPVPARSEGTQGTKAKSLSGTNLFDITVPVNDLSRYKVEDLLKMIPLGIRFWKGKAIAISELLKDSQSDVRDEILNKYISISFNRVTKTVVLTAKRSGYLYFENMDFVQPEIELRARDIANPDYGTKGGDGWKYIDDEDFIKADERLFKEIKAKDFAKMDEWKEKPGSYFFGLLSHGEFSESWKPLQYDFIHLFPDSVSQIFSSSRIKNEIFYPLENPKIEARTYIKLKIFNKD